MAVDPLKKTNRSREPRPVRQSRRGRASDPEILDGIVEEFTQRIRQGEFPSIAEYQEKYPNLKDEIDDLLASVALIEKLKGESDSRPNRKSLFHKVEQLRQIGDYHIIREVGRGGMGIVFEAIHESLGRRVAIKVMPTPLVNGEQFVERFKRESKSAAKLHHTNIVSVFGIGRQEGFHYYVMDFVDGQSLSNVISGLRKVHSRFTSQASQTTQEGHDNSDTKLKFDDCGKPPATKISPAQNSDDTPGSSAAKERRLGNDRARHFRWAARIGANIADALAYAHESRILHRDIKPANIILDRKGIVWITDFGLAKDNSEELNLTKTGDVIGTPQYLAPESLEGKYDQRSETYCLGLTLYELVTLRPAYKNGTTAEVIRAIATATPLSPRKINRQIPLDLSTIIDKAISRNPTNRYQTAQEMRNDLLAFVEDRPIAARRLFFVERAIRWSQRNPLAAGLSAVSLVLLILVAVSASIGYFTTMDALNKEAEKSSRLAIQQLETERARKAAERNFEQMKAQFDRAEANVAITIEAFDQMFKQVIVRGSAALDELDLEGFREVSGIETSITKDDADFLQQLLRFYEEFTTLNGDNERLIAESAKAFRRVGNIYQLVGEMQPAIQAYENSLTRYQSILASNPESTQHLLTLVRTQNELSVARRKNGDSLLAHELNRKSLKLLEDSNFSKDDKDVRLELARTLSVMGFNLYRISTMGMPAWPGRAGMTGRPGRGAVTNARRSGANVNRPRNQAYWIELLRGGRRGMERRNRQLIERAIDIMDDLVAADPDNAEFLSVRATCYSVLAAARIGFDRDAGLRMRDTAITAFESLIQEHPGNPEFRYLLALACTIGSSTPHRDDAILIQRSVDITARLIDQFPNMLDYHHLFASLNIKLAGISAREGKLDQTFQNLKTASNSIEVLLEFTPSDKSFLRTFKLLAEGLQRLAATYEAKGQKRKASEVSQLLRQIRNRMRSTAESTERNEQRDND